MLKDHSEPLNEVKHDEYSRAFIDGQRINLCSILSITPAFKRNRSSKNEVRVPVKTGKWKPDPHCPRQRRGTGELGVGVGWGMATWGKAIAHSKRGCVRIVIFNKSFLVKSAPSAVFLGQPKICEMTFWQLFLSLSFYCGEITMKIAFSLQWEFWPSSSAMDTRHHHRGLSKLWPLIWEKLLAKFIFLEFSSF